MNRLIGLNYGADDGGSGGGAADDVVTLSKADYEKLQKNAEQKYAGGINEGQERIIKKITDIVSKKGFQPKSNDVEEVLNSVFSGYETKIKEPNEQVTLLSEQLKVKDNEVGKFQEEAKTARQERDNYIIDAELYNLVGGQVHDAKAAIALLKQMSDLKIIRTQDGELRVHKGGERYLVNGQYATLKDVAEEFLQKNQWLVKPSDGSGGSGKERSGINMNTLDPTKVSPAQGKQMLDDLMTGKLSLTGN